MNETCILGGKRLTDYNKYENNDYLSREEF